MMPTGKLVLVRLNLDDSITDCEVGLLQCEVYFTEAAVPSMPPDGKRANFNAKLHFKHLKEVKWLQLQVAAGLCSLTPSK